MILGSNSWIKGVEDCKKYCEENNLKFPDLGKPLRLMLTGKENAPSISELLYILGKETSLKRIEYTLND